MTFPIQPQGYIFDIFSDLKRTFYGLRDNVVKLTPSNLQQRLLFHIREATREDNVHALLHMKNAFLGIQNIVQQENLSGEIVEAVEAIQLLFDELFEALSSGEQ